MSVDTDKIIYVVEALRYGDREKHSYVVGVYTSEVDAKYNGDIEVEWRGGKYLCEIKKVWLDKKPLIEKVLTYEESK